MSSFGVHPSGCPFSDSFSPPGRIPSRGVIHFPSPRARLGIANRPGLQRRACKCFPINTLQAGLNGHAHNNRLRQSGVKGHSLNLLLHFRFDPQRIRLIFHLRQCISLLYIVKTFLKKSVDISTTSLYIHLVMANNSQVKTPLSTPIPIRLSHEIRRQIKLASRVSGLKFQDIVRLALHEGVPIIQRKFSVNGKAVAS